MFSPQLRLVFIMLSFFVLWPLTNMLFCWLIVTQNLGGPDWLRQASRGLLTLSLLVNASFALGFIHFWRKA